MRESTRLSINYGSKHTENRTQRSGLQASLIIFHSNNKTRDTFSWR